MSATRQSSLDVEDALLRAGQRLGLRGLLLRMVASELPDNPWLLDLHLEAAGAEVVAKTTHLCGPGCQAELDGCLTAFKVEDTLTKRTGKPHALLGVRAEGEALHLRLGRVGI